jgi:3',5'-nucleoside bisphosphate phosphatase
MSPMRLDLHLHSDVSDGRISPAAAVQTAASVGLDVIALTDHDTAAGVDSAKGAARALPVYVIPGIEISTRFGPCDLHILGYWIDPGHPAIQEHQASARIRRTERMHAMIDKLRALGVRVTFEDVLDAIGPSVEVLGRPHLARALHAVGETRYYAEAFDRYLYDGGPAFVAEAFPTVAEAVERIHAAGGIAVWAHPPRHVFDKEIADFADLGLDGVECLRPLNPPAESLYLEAGAHDLGLLVTGGSDWHGPGHSELGQFAVRPYEVRSFLDAPQCAPLLEWRRAMVSRSGAPPLPPPQYS